MIISDLNYLQTAEANVEGGTFPYSYFQYDFVAIDFNSYNSFRTEVNSPRTYSNSASAGAKGDAINNTRVPSYAFTKADTLAVTELFGGSFSASTSVAVINPIF
jgi:hypothetical protein